MDAVILTRILVGFLLPAMLFAVVAGVRAEETAVPAPVIKEVTPAEAQALIQANAGNAGFVILDVRTPEEFAAGHLAQAVNLDYYAKGFGAELGKLDRARTYLVYCRSGKRSAAAVDMMKELDFKAVYGLTGGIIAWTEAGLPTLT